MTDKRKPIFAAFRAAGVDFSNETNIAVVDDVCNTLGIPHVDDEAAESASKAEVVTVKSSFALGAKSNAELAGVHPKLAQVVQRAIQLTEQDFSVHDGLRTIAEQREYVRRGVSKTMNSMHMKQADGFGHAVDLVPVINGQLRWEWKPIYAIAAAVRLAAAELDVKLIWGGVWDRPFEALQPIPDYMEKAVNACVERRRKAGKSAFIDGPHFELAR